MEDLTRIGIILNVMKSFIRICQPGEYTFYIKACNSDGIWGMRQVSMSWFIPPVWLTGWAKVIYVLLALMLVGGVL